MTDQAVNVAGNNYDKYGSTNPIEQRMMSGFFTAFDAMLADINPATVVEVGAGEGRITRHLAERFPTADVVGLDLPDDDLVGEWDAMPRPMFFADVNARFS